MLSCRESHDRYRADEDIRPYRFSRHDKVLLQGIHQRLEALAPLHKVLELVKGGAGGGIRALGVHRAWVMGQVAPGVPVWRTGEESKFPGLSYVIFPGNVGGVTTLRDIVAMLLMP